MLLVRENIQERGDLMMRNKKALYQYTGKDVFAHAE